MAIACTMSDETYFYILSKFDESPCDQFESCDECPYYDKHHPEEVNDA